MNPKLILVGLLCALGVLLLGAYFYFGVTVTREPLPEASESAPPGVASPPSPVVPAGADLQGAAPLSQGFLEFLKRESRTLESPKVNTGAVEQQLAAEAAKMGEPEMRHSLNLALDSAAPASQRILGVYLLNEAGEKAWPTLRELLGSPLKEKGGGPHTVAEVKSVQEKALRAMAVDALAERAATDPRARAELVRWSTDFSDPTLRSYILKKLQELP